MPTYKLLLFFVGGICAATTVAADDFPYTAYVAADKAEIVAGPGHRFYATDHLARGTKVEIYREEPSGWLAIRPPEGSFSWVPAEYVERLDDEKLGRVKQPTGAWIGTSVEHVGEHQQQITLKAGELVQILAEKVVSAKGGKEQIWLKISPPAGEYRWVHLRDVSRQKPEEPMPQVAPEVVAVSQEEVPRHVELASGTEASREKEERLPRYDRRVEPAQFHGTPNVGESRAVSPDGFVPRKRRDNDQAPRPTSVAIPTRPNLDPSARFAAATPARQSPATGGSSPSGRSGLSDEEIVRQLDQIEVDLSLMIAQDRSQWNLAALRKRVDTLVEGGADPASRGRARLVLDKIKQFEDAFDSRSGVSTDRSLGSQAKPATSSSLADPRYDAQGWLKPVVSRKGDKSASPYAVVDAEGQPLCFISPSPGLNLNRYLNKQVGLYGRRGYLEELKKPHLMAERVIELDTHLR